VEGVELRPPQTFKAADFLGWVQEQQFEVKEILNRCEPGRGAKLFPPFRSANVSLRSGALRGIFLA
jgi:hypothetical protein